MKHRLNSIEYILHTSDAVRAFQTKWLNGLNRPMILNRLIEETVP